MRQLLIATRNAHKTQEIAEMLGDQWQVHDLNTHPEKHRLPEIEETGTTFEANASLKALGISTEIDGLILSDDSGLEVDALDGAPGVYSARYGGEAGNHDLNNEKLLSEMNGQDNRSARFRCCMILAENGQAKGSFNGTVEGTILSTLIGQKGFGYDPLFVPEGHQKSFAELGNEIKNTMSHRARALEKVIQYLSAE